MKVESISIHNFKIFDKEVSISFKNKVLDEVSDRFLILGDNGTGKTTLLQAIALPLALATRQIRRVTEFDWIGFLPQRYQRWGSPRIELDVSFTDEELEITRNLANRWHDAQPDLPFVEPGNSSIVHLVLEGESCRAETASEYCQFSGRYYATQLLETNPSIRSLFSRLPGLFWFDQFRNAGYTSPSHSTNIELSEQRNLGYYNSRISFEFGVSKLRKYLNGWKLAQLTHTYNVDYLLELENLYKKVFRGRSFAGLEPIPGVDTPTPEDYYFLVNDGNRTYDLTEMSGGEQSIFPILYEFIQKQIAYSVVLIDEIDMHLHPPAAQFLVSQLPKISPTSQFIFTTHSSAVNSIIGEADTFRLPGGSLCL
ncbi:MAG TPA: AAA family ATPase [Cyanobacteria bacterium UBA11149]|nr:AAA family ATPase [Cyanobacteria bacterium UBA11367]HBE59411.1 AAA family ATPase [Cyanobacteria bacterium UBA11366]HBK64852.1 AAA family ATPase [Cyanobacteria bacterium UBA11166]HBR74924.1 AAA family ATPase [Cyanobacteria bacterium UBA11159]HBS69465.1 AAA family ATPase [Cyanobacteria bacterium UBA11153]HBW88620.1 AAA family ATPase [Cyanobacteria bacterium UBA11149]HCA97107.1 AAA family ATPase [Cyanobacteria bacterium UBA9226]